MYDAQKTLNSFKAAGVLLLCLLLGACYSPPFRRTELVPLGEVEPVSAAEGFERRLPGRFETENTIVFRFFRNELAALGYASVDREKEAFEILCLNHMGVQLFHISGDDDGNHLIYAMPEFRKYPEFVDAVGDDIRRVYFDLAPPARAESRVRRDRIMFRRSEKGKTVEYVFGGRDKNLLKKRGMAGRRTLWEVEFFEYATLAGPEGEYVFPGGAVLHNRRHRYRLIIRTRSVDLL